MDSQRRLLPKWAYAVAALMLIAAVLAVVRHNVRRANLAGRLRSPAAVRVIEPSAGAVTGEVVHARFAVTGARVTQPSRTRIVSDEGHLHLTLDGRALDMQYTSDAELRVRKGPHVLNVEFVSSDHRPFNRRVTTSVRFQAR